MITFKIAFILAFSTVTKTEIKKKEQEKINKKKKDDDKNLKNKKSKNDENGKSETILIHPKHVFEVDKLIGVAHIEYELIPNKVKYHIDVKCWGSIAKIFTNDGQITLKTIIRDNTAWVPISLEHFIQHLSLEEIKHLHNHIVKFDVVNNYNKLGKIATFDKSKKFYARTNEADLNCFVEVYDHDPNLPENVIKEKDSLEEIVENIITKCINLSECEYATRLLFLNNFDLIYEIINKHCAGTEIEYKDFVLPCSVLNDMTKKVKLNLDEKNTKVEKIKMVKDKTKNKDKKSDLKMIKSDNLTVSVPAEIFFTDNWATYKEENKNCVIRNVYVSISVQHLLSRAQKLLLDPLVIKIKKMSNVPVDLLKEMGITSVYATYNIPFVADCTTIQKPLEKIIKFDESHIFFNDSISKLKLIEFMQTKKFHVEIHGIKDLPFHQPNCLLFGNETDDKNISKMRSLRRLDQNTGPPDTSVLLAICVYDISSLIQNIWDFKEKGQCHMPGLTLYEKYMGYYDVIKHPYMRNVNEINLKSNCVKVKHPISEETFVNLGTTLKVEVYLMAPQTASLILLRIPNTFKRFLFTLPTRELARSLLASTMKHNESILSTKRMASEEKDLEFLDIITGFMIDNESSCAFFVEGLSTGFILSIENITITDYEIEKGKFFFNSDTVFEKRLYTSFIREGLNIITLRIPFYKILSDQRVYLDGNVPFPCLEALKKLYLLFQSALFKSILQLNLLPKPQELLSLNLEWGSPLMVK